MSLLLSYWLMPSIIRNNSRAGHLVSLGSTMDSLISGTTLSWGPALTRHSKRANLNSVFLGVLVSVEVFLYSDIRAILRLRHGGSFALGGE